MTKDERLKLRQTLLYLADAMVAVDRAPTIDAIPVEWIKALTNHSDMFTRGAAKWVLGCWKKEQEARGCVTRQSCISR